jgi:glycosyltransferase involved in cell wall biosynthesis
LLADPTLRQTYGENARQRVEERFNREQMIERTRQVYAELLDEE